MGPGRESAPPFAQESNLLSWPRRVKDFFLESFLFPAPRPALRAARRLGAALLGAPPSSEGLAIIPRPGRFASVFPDFFRLGGSFFE